MFAMVVIKQFLCCYFQPPKKDLCKKFWQTIGLEKKHDSTFPYLCTFFFQVYYAPACDQTILGYTQSAMAKPTPLFMAKKNGEQNFFGKIFSTLFSPFLLFFPDKVCFGRKLLCSTKLSFCHCLSRTPSLCHRKIVLRKNVATFS